jgi:hypothetical protein
MIEPAPCDCAACEALSAALDKHRDVLQTLVRTRRAVRRAGAAVDIAHNLPTHPLADTRPTGDEHA